MGEPPISHLGDHRGQQKNWPLHTRQVRSFPPQSKLSFGERTRKEGARWTARSLGGKVTRCALRCKSCQSKKIKSGDARDQTVDSKFSIFLPVINSDPAPFFPLPLENNREGGRKIARAAVCPAGFRQVTRHYYRTIHLSRFLTGFGSVFSTGTNVPELFVPMGMEPGWM